MDETYTDFLIRVGARSEAEGAYPVTAELGDGATHDGWLRLDQDALRRAELHPEDYGLLLFEALFAGHVGQAYERATGRGEGAERPVRIRLWIDDGASELHALPWERVYHMRKGHPVPLLTSTLTPFSRLVATPRAFPQPVTERPIRILFAVANPLDLDRWNMMPLDVEEEVAALRSTLGELHQRGLVQIRIMVGRTGLHPNRRSQLKEEGYEILDGPTSLTNLLGWGRDCHVFHVMCHGATARQQDIAAVALERANGSLDLVKDRDLVQRLAAADSLPHLLFLVSGDRAPERGENPHVRLGRGLVRLGIPAVITMQDVITIRGARQLTNDFYGGLVEHGLVDQALNEARLLLFEPGKMDWAIPVLFTSLKTGRLFVTARAQAPDLQPEAEAFARRLDALQAAVQESETTRAAVTELVQPFREVAEELRKLRKLAELSEHLGTLRNAFRLCVTTVERAGPDLNKIQVEWFAPAWDFVRLNSLNSLEQFVRENPDLGAQPWSQPLMEQADQIENNLPANLGSVAKGVKTFETQLVRAESYVRQQLNQAIGSLVQFSDLTLGRMAVD
jgi:hypothetical protein